MQPTVRRSREAIRSVRRTCIGLEATIGGGTVTSSGMQFERCNIFSLVKEEAWYYGSILF